MAGDTQKVSGEASLTMISSPVPPHSLPALSYFSAGAFVIIAALPLAPTGTGSLMH